MFDFLCDISPDAWLEFFGTIVAVPLTALVTIGSVNHQINEQKKMAKNNIVSDAIDKLLKIKKDFINYDSACLKAQKSFDKNGYSSARDIINDSIVKSGFYENSYTILNIFDRLEAQGLFIKSNDQRIAFEKNSNDYLKDIHLLNSSIDSFLKNNNPWGSLNGMKNKFDSVKSDNGHIEKIIKCCRRLKK